MTNIELSLWIEANYPISGRGGHRKPVYGVGTNDADYITAPMANGVKLWDPAYKAWSGILQRAYSQKFHAANPTYVGVTVCKEWHSFRAFRAWWLDNYRDGFQCDKDLMSPGNREYAPYSCVYVPKWLNTFTIDCGAVRGEFPIGVSIHKTGKYRSRCCNPITGKRHNLGLFNTPEEANEAWLDFKLSIADRLKKEMDRIDQRIYNNVRTIIIVNALC